MLKISAIILVTLSGFIILGFVSAPELREPGQLVAYRGGGQIIDYQKLGEDGCSARSVVQSENVHIENTAESIKDADSAGFDVIHINIHHSKDNKFVLFHDWTLDCATNGKGEVRDSTASLLSELDAGYGYTFDNGLHFPFREKGYRIDNLTAVLDAYPDKTFWFNLKNNDEASFVALYELLSSSYGGDYQRLLFFLAKRVRVGLNVKPRH